MIKKKKSRAMALVVVLSVVVILSLIVVSLTVAMRMERQAAFYFSERSRADLLVKEGVEMVKMLLSDSMGSTNNYVVSMPGRLMVLTNGVWEAVNLASGPAATAGAGLLAPADLNKTNKTGDNMRQIDPLGGPMVVPWIYVYVNGDRTTNASPTIISNNPIIGRYAFWVDDESTRINLNTAWKAKTDTASPQNTNGSSHPSQIALRGLFASLSGAEAYDVYNGTKLRSLQSSSELSRIFPALSLSLSTNRFFATHFSRSSDLNPWGEPKIVLTTKSNLANGRPFLDILNNQAADPGINASIDIAKVSVQLQRLNELLSRTNWPMFPNESFAKKYRSYQPDRIAQLSLDIIDYVRAAESTNLAVSMLRMVPSGGGFISGQLDQEILLSSSRRPMITEIAAWASGSTNANGRFEFQARIELYLPPHYGISSYPVKPSGGITNKLTIQTVGMTIMVNEPITDSWDVQPAAIPAGGYAVITTPKIEMYNSTNNFGGTNNWNRFYMRVVLSKANNDFIDQATHGWGVAPAGQGVYYPPISNIPRPTTGAVPGLDESPSTEVDDPRLNKYSSAWQLRSSGNSFGAANGRWKSSPFVSSSSPQQDVDGSTYSDYSLQMPPPKGQAGNLFGMVSSVAELGRVSTGIENAGAYTNQNVPWRTLRFQPTRTADTSIPDWALFELFAAPTATNHWPIYYPSSNTVAGRVNINTRTEPFATNSKRPPLEAVFAGLTNGNASNVIENVMGHVLASGGRDFGTTNVFKGAGELVEIKGVSDGGESSEDNLPGIIGPTTVRSDVYRVLCIGQSIKQTPTGGLTINATKSVETIIESQKDGTQFRSTSWRENPL